MTSRGIAFLLAFLAALIYGVSFTIAKEVMPLYVKPFGFILLRVTGASILFWTVGFFLKKEKKLLNSKRQLLKLAFQMSGIQKGKIPCI